MRNPTFCALCSVYAGEKAENFDMALQSVIKQTQSIPIFLVVDGPIGEDLEHIILRYRKNMSAILRLDNNAGLANALNFGIQFIGQKFDYVIRFDSDDINEPMRFETLMRVIEESGADLISSEMIEFSDEGYEKILGVRIVPKSSEAIARSVHLRNPFNHPAVAFRISHVLNVGGYEDVPYFEDWYLWAKMIKSGAKTSNLDDALVRFRGGKSALSRRRGWDYARCELSFFLLLYKLQLQGRWVLFFIVPVRLLTRLMPYRIFRGVYYMSRRVA